jgi:signal transduction histidine kinase
LALGGDVYLLKIELRGPLGQRVNTTLPCPSGELNRWLAASQGELSSGQLNTLIRSNPTLLLIAVSRAVDCTGAPIQSMVKLQSRLDHCFLEGNPLETALGHVLDVQPCDSQHFEWDVQSEAILGQFLQSKKRSTLLKSLVKFVRFFNKQQLPKADRPKRSAVKGLIDSMFVDSFRIRRQKRSNTDWSNEKKSPLKQNLNSVVLGLLQERQSNKTEFAAKLLDAKLAAMKQLAYGASHEINNPLANVATRAHTMLADETNPDRRFQLAVMHEQAMRAHDMISDMMLFAHPPKLNVKAVDIRLMVSALVRECEANMMAISRSGATIVAKVSQEVDRAIIDPTHCKVAIASLIQNAAEAIRHDHGEIEIHLRHDSNDLCITVSDNGIGINEQVRQHLFDPFYSGREAGRGLGFGLSKCWRIAKLHGGSLTHRFDADSLRTIFELRLPI